MAQQSKTTVTNKPGNPEKQGKIYVGLFTESPALLGSQINCVAYLGMLHNSSFLYCDLGSERAGKCILPCFVGVVGGAMRRPGSGGGKEK